MAYSVRLPQFEGPLDLLLHLIRSRKLDISEIAISLVTEQYLGYLSMMEALDLEIAGEFVLIAATLMEIKSRVLLPRPAPPLDEEPGQDPRAELVARLLEYERFQQVAEQLRELAEESRRTFPRGAVEQWEGAVPLVELRPGDLLAALRRMKSEGETGENGGSVPAALRVRRHGVNLRQRIAEVFSRVAGSEGPLPFSAILTRGGRYLSRSEVLVTFLAILELVRLGRISAWQDAVFGEIYLRPRDEGLGEGAAAGTSGT